MHQTLATVCILALSCGDGGAEQSTSRKQAPQPRTPDATIAAPPLPKGSATERLKHDLERYQGQRRHQRFALRGVKTGRPLGKTVAGRRAYDVFIRLHATTTKTTAALRRLVYAELASAEREIAALLAGRSRREVSDGRDHVGIAKRAQRRAMLAAAPAFGRVPNRQRIRVIRSRTAPLAYYTDRAVHLNLHKANRPPAHLVEAIIFHETVPGHHLESSLYRARDGDSVGGKDKRNDDNDEPFTGFIEGWGLYAEQLAAELGLYSNDASRIGHFELRAWRAARAAADIGLHDEGWTMKRARSFMTKHTVLSAATIKVELKRVLDRPGRVQAYVIGARTILGLRSQARSQLGPLFSLRAFHSVILGSGRVPLATLERLVNEWIAKVHRDQRA